MRKLLKILAVFIVFLVILYGTLAVLISIKGRGLLKAFLEKKVGFPVKIGSVYVSPFFSFNITDVIFENFSAEKIVVEPFWDIFRGRVLLNRIVLISPRIVLVKSKNKWLTPFDNLIASGKQKNIENKTSVKVSKGKDFLFLDRVKVKNGSIVLKSADSSKSIILGNIYINSDVPDIFQWNKRKIMAQADLYAEGLSVVKDFKFLGWMDFLKKSMQAKLSIKVIPYHKMAFLLPYFLRPEFMGFASADFSLDADFVSINNDLAIDCYWRLLDYKPVLQREQSLAGRVVLQSLVSIFEKKGKKVPFHCRIKTKFDRPTIDFTRIGSQILERIGGITLTAGRQAVKGGVNTTKRGIAAAVRTAVNTVKTRADIPMGVLETVIDTITGSQSDSK